MQGLPPNPEKISALIRRTLERENGEVSNSYDSLIKDIEKDVGELKPGQKDLNKRAIMIIRDRLRNFTEKALQKENLPDDAELHPTVGELTERYNHLLSRLLINPSTGMPYFIVDLDSPGENYLKVTIPEAIQWIFSFLNNGKEPSLWVNNDSHIYGMIFLNVISATCAGVENLIDVNKLMTNPSFQLSDRMIESRDHTESRKSKMRRLAMQVLAPVFNRKKFEFNLDDALYQGLAIAKLTAIPSTNRWHRNACINEDYRDFVYTTALILDRMDEPEKAAVLLEWLFEYNPDDEKLCYQVARMRVKRNDFRLAEEAINRAIALKDREFYRACRRHIMEKVDLPDPLESGCPIIMRIYDLITGELRSGEDRIVMRHIEHCSICRAWYEIMTEIMGVKDPI